jgi:hypothetical protein
LEGFLIELLKFSLRLVLGAVIAALL